MEDSTVTRDPAILGGTPVFTGTRVPVRILMEHLEAGDALDVFLDSFPSVSRQQAVEVITTVAPSYGPDCPSNAAARVAAPGSAGR